MYEKRKKKMKGSAKSTAGAKSAGAKKGSRMELVKKVMKEQGLSLGKASKYIKDNNLYYKGYNGLGNQIRDILFINDLCELISLQIRNFNRIKNQTFCVGGGIKNSANLNELTRICEKITKNKLKIKRDLQTSIYDIPFYITSLKKVKKYYNWMPKTNLRFGFSILLEWMKKNYTLIKPHF